MEKSLLKVSQSTRGLWRVLVPGLTVGVLPDILLPTAPFVLLEDHDLDDSLRWVDVSLPVSPLSPASIHRVRRARMDLLYSLEGFLAAVDEFEGKGICLWQLTKPPSDTLRLTDMSERATLTTLQQIGFALSVHLPHAGELALVQALDRETLERVALRIGSSPTGGPTPPMRGSGFE